MANHAHRSPPAPDLLLRRDQRRFLRALALAFALVTGVHLIVALAQGAYESPLELAGYPVYGAFLALTLWLLRRDQIALGGWLLVGSLYAAMTAIAVLWGVVEPGVVVSLVNTILIAGFGLGARAAGIAAAASLVTAAVLVTVDTQRLLPAGVWRPTEALRLLFFLAALATSGALIYVGLRRLRSAIREALASEKEAQHTLAALRATQAANEGHGRRGRALAALAERLVEERDVEALLRAGVEALMESLELRFVAALHGHPAPQLITAEGLSEGAAPSDAIVAALPLREPAVVTDPEALRPLLSGLADPSEVGALVLAPVPARNGRAGFAVASARPLDRDAHQLLRTLADMVGAALERHLADAELRHAQKLEVIGHIAGGVAHDFNNLLTTIIGSAQLLRDERGADDPDDELLAAIVTSGEHAAMLTRQLLSFSRGRGGERAIQDLRDVTRELERLLRRVVGERHTLDVQTGSDPLVLEANRGNLEQILLNLVSNARDAMEVPGTITVRLNRVEHPDGAVGELFVSDDGRGMPAAVREHVFEPFFTTKDGGRGTGLGLATVARIVEDLAGSIDVESTPGRGTTFRVALPLRDATGQTPTPAALPRPGKVTGTTVLVVDDNPLVRRSVGAQLERLGYRVVVAATGTEALLLLGRGPVDLVLSDVVMPGTSGVELVAAIREAGYEPAIVLMTGYADPALDLASVAGVADVLHKPFRPQLLQRRLEAALEQTGPGAVAQAGSAG